VGLSHIFREPKTSYSLTIGVEKHHENTLPASGNWIAHLLEGTDMACIGRYIYRLPACGQRETAALRE
jgi:hypothetical protein